ncbi:MAG: hypothetical protein ACYDBH_03000 [Acidobacteriaceae bacterium]
MANKEPLAALARSYPPGSRGLGTLVLREYGQILAARQRGWTWKDVASGMDLPETKAHALADAYRRVSKRIEDGHLVASPAKAAPQRPAQASKPADGPFDINSIPRISGERKDV